MNTDTSGFRLARPLEAFFEERSLAAVMTTYCVCGQRFDGTARECIDRMAAHREASHPEMRDRGQRERRAAAKAAPTVYWTGRGSLGEQ